LGLQVYQCHQIGVKSAEALVLDISQDKIMVAQPQLRYYTPEESLELEEKSESINISTVITYRY